MASQRELVTAEDSSGVLIRPYETTDRERFLSLYETVWDRRKEQEWFDWRFSANPYRDGVQMVVAEQNGEMVGAEPLLPFRLRVGSRTLDAYQPVDWIVHPDYRRQGIFTQMTEFLLDQYDDADLLFNFPSDALLPGLEKFDWTTVGEVSMSYRVHHPQNLLGESVGTLTRALSSALNFATNGGLALLDRTNTPPNSITVERDSDIAIETLSELYASTVPERIHIPRDEAFLEWRFENPHWETTTYTALEDGIPIGSVVTATEDVDSYTRTNLIDIQPMDKSDSSSEAIDALLTAILTDHKDIGVLRATTGASGSFRQYGFLPDRLFPVSRVTDSTTHVVRPLGSHRHEDSSPIQQNFDTNGLDLVNSEDWLLLPADLDIE